MLEIIMKNIFIALLICLLAGCAPAKLRFDKNGVAHGTGWREFRYKSGELMLKDYYKDGQLERSIWQKPDGTVVREEDWQDRAGTGLYLREDGSIKTVMPYVNGIAHGMAIYYKPDGSIDKVEEFVRGKQKE